MRFLWPAALLALAAIPVLILLYAWWQRRRRRFAVRFSSLSLVRAAIPAQSRLRRFLPMALLLLALASLTVGFARPVAVTLVPASRATIMLTLDVSGSMRQTDIQPTRLLAAEQAALRFIDRQKRTNQIGIVAFAGFAELVQPPTTDQDLLNKAIRSLTTGRRTAIGEGIVTALHTITDFDQGGGAANGALAQGGLAQGEFRPDIIVVLTDGVSNAGMDPLEAAAQARDNQVRVYTIGYGTKNPTMGRARGGRNGPFGGMNFGIDEKALQDIASMTGGKYYSANSADELQQVFDSLPTVLISREETMELSVAFAGLAAVLMAVGLLLGQLWHPLP